MGKGWTKFTPAFSAIVFVKNPAWRWWKFWQQPRFIQQTQRAKAKYKLEGKTVKTKISVKGTFNAN